MLAVLTNWVAGIIKVVPVDSKVKRNFRIASQNEKRKKTREIVGQPLILAARLFVWFLPVF